MPQGFPDPYSSFSKGFTSSFLPLIKLKMEKEKEAKEEAARSEKIKFDRDMKSLDFGMRALALKNPSARNLALKMIAHKNFGGDKEKADEVTKAIGAFSDEERKAMADDMDLFKKSILGGKKPSPELASRIKLYESMFQRGEIDPEKLLTLSESLQKRASEQEAIEITREEVNKMAAPQTTPQPPIAGPPAGGISQAAPPIGPPGITGPGSEPGGLGSTALAQQLLAKARGGVPAGAGETALSAEPSPAGAPVPPSQDQRTQTPADLTVEQLRKLEGILRQKGTPEAIKQAESMAKFAEAKIKDTERSQPKVGKYRGFGKDGVVDTTTGTIVRQPSEGGEVKTINMGQGILGLVKGNGKIDFIQAPQFKKEGDKPFSVGQGIVAKPEKDGEIKFEQAPQFETEGKKPPQTREIKRGDKFITQEFDSVE